MSSRSVSFNESEDLGVKVETVSQFSLRILLGSLYTCLP